MGTKSSVKRKVGKHAAKIPRSVFDSAIYDPFSPYKRGPGRPTVSDGYLTIQRDNLIHLLEPIWAEIGWELLHVNIPADVLKAFQPIAGKPNLGPLLPLLRTSRQPATREMIDQARKLLGAAVKEAESIDDQHQKAGRSYEEAANAAFTVSETYKNQLKQALKGRLKNIRDWKVKIIDKKGKIHRAKLHQRKEIGQEAASEKAELSNLAESLRKLEDDVVTDQKVCKEIQEQIDLITPQRLKLATQVEVARKESLTSCERNLVAATKRQNDLQSRLLDQEAYFFRSQLLKFIRDKRYAHDNPRSLANAIAGLPYLTCRQSAERCSKPKSKVFVYLSYQVFKFVQSVWNRRGTRGKALLVDWFKENIEKLRKTRIIEGRKTENMFRKHLADDWAYLKLAVKRTQQLRVDPNEMPFRITQHYLKNSRTANSVDRILADQEKIRGYESHVKS